MLAVRLGACLICLTLSASAVLAKENPSPLAQGRLLARQSQPGSQPISPAQAQQVRQHFDQSQALFKEGRLDEALVEIERALALRPQAAALYAARGLILFRQNKLDQAEADFDRAISMEPDLHAAYEFRARIKLSKGQRDKAEADWAQAQQTRQAKGLPALGPLPASPPSSSSAASAPAPVTASPAPPPPSTPPAAAPPGREPATAEEFYQRGNNWGRQHQLDKALADFDQAIRLKPDYAQAHFNRAMALADMGRLPEAVAGYTKVLELDPGFLPVFNDRGRVLLKMGRIKEALADFERAVNQDVDKKLKVYGLHNRGNARMKMGQFTAAADDYTQAMTLGYKPWDLYMARGEAYRLGRQYEPALADYRQVRQMKPDLPDACIFSAMTLAALERYAEALAEADQALKMRPGQPKALAVRGNLLFLNGQFAEAAKVMEPLLATTDPQYRPTLLLWTYVARERGGQPSRDWLAQQAKGMDPGQWPGVIVNLFLGQATPQDVNGQAVMSTRVAEEARHQQNQAYYFLSQHYLLTNRPIDARINLEHCIRRDMQDTGEFLAARAELKRLGPEPERKPRKGKAKQE